MSEFLKFTCPKCGEHEIQCLQDNVRVSQKIRIPADENGYTHEWYDESDIDDSDAVILEYRCAHCDHLLPVEGSMYSFDHSELRDYLKSLPENREESK